MYSLGPASAVALLETNREFLQRSFILPYISSTKSPQQIMGSLIKHYLGEKENRSPAQIYHATVMMCYDKKLEASRGDFYNDLYRTRDVDCVITSRKSFFFLLTK